MRPDRPTSERTPANPLTKEPPSTTDDASAWCTQQCPHPLVERWWRGRPASSGPRLAIYQATVTRCAACGATAPERWSLEWWLAAARKGAARELIITSVNPAPGNPPVVGLPSWRPKEARTRFAGRFRSADEPTAGTKHRTPLAGPPAHRWRLRTQRHERRPQRGTATSPRPQHRSASRRDAARNISRQHTAR